MQDSNAAIAIDGPNAKDVYDSVNTSAQSDSTLGLSSVEHPLPIAPTMGAVSDLDWKKDSTNENQTLTHRLHEIQM